MILKKNPFSLYITATYAECIHSENKIPFTSTSKNPLYLPHLWPLKPGWHAFEPRTHTHTHIGSYRHTHSSTINTLSLSSLPLTCFLLKTSSPPLSDLLALQFHLQSCLWTLWLVYSESTYWGPALCQALFVHSEQNPGKPVAPKSQSHLLLTPNVRILVSSGGLWPVGMGHGLVSGASNVTWIIKKRRIWT